jgi:hypothetical protein
MEMLKEYWGLIVAGVTLVVWSIRLEAKANENSKEIRRIWAQRAEDLAAHKEAREATNLLLTELRNDVKILLGRVRH